MLELIKVLGFAPKENTTSIYQKKYANNDDYIIEIDIEKNIIDFGNKIFFNDSSKNKQNITKDEDKVVLECVDRLLEKDYNPKNIILEKVWDAGHGHSGRLDILVTRDDKSAYMMIECKTWGKEFDKAFTKLNKDGGQLFTYFRFDTKADILVLYASRLDNNSIEYTNQIVKIEEEYREASNLNDFYDRWNKIPKDNGVFEGYVNIYEFVSKALTKTDLKVLKQEDSSFIFNRFLEILRHNVVSDKPNAFNKIFTLFLCKIIDEDRLEDEELHFQWLDGEDNHISFQKRLTDLYTRGMNELLEKKVTDVSDSEFNKRFKIIENEYKDKFDEFKDILTEIRLKKNNEFAIKEVFDNDSFNENAIVVKEIVELLQTYQIRYTYRQQFLSDFFEQLLTTGLKQESGQFFTPVPIARFIIKSMPFDKIIKEKMENGDKSDLLPAIIDYSAGSGHFITESMEDVQKYIDTLDESKFKTTTRNSITNWKNAKYDWAESYVYAIEKDYRLVKTAKVSCYLHGDGLAKVIHGDGLADFTTAKEYKNRLKIADKTYPQDNKQFDIIVSNPPYSVSAFKSMMDSEKTKKNFELYDKLTDQSSEIEALFIERTKQLLKDGGIAGIILPSSILSNGGIYTKTREIIFKYFDIISITELGSNTFMATGTNTVALFLRRKNNMEHKNIEASVKKLFETKQDITINGIEDPLLKYINYVWEDIALDDYITLLKNNPNKKIKTHELYIDYSKKIKTNEDIIASEKEKLTYFIYAYKQKVTVVKTGAKKEEKRFLGYEFSNRRGREGIHPIQRGKSIDECTVLYDENSYTNPLKANSYIYSAFNGELNNVNESLKNNISYMKLIDMMMFDRIDFYKSISLNVKKKVKIESKWDIEALKEFVDLQNGFAFKSSHYVEKSSILNFRQANIRLKGILDLSYKETFLPELFKVKYKDYLLKNNDIVIAMTDMNSELNLLAIPTIFKNTTNKEFLLNQRVGRFIDFKLNKIIPAYLSYILKSKISREQLKALGFGSVQFNLSKKDLLDFKIPLPPKDIQENIVNEIEKLENQNQKLLKEIEQLKENIEKMFVDTISRTNTKVRLSDTSIFNISIGKRVLKGDVKINGHVPIYSANVFEPFGYIDKHLLDEYSVPSVLWGIDGDWMVNYFPKEKPFYPTDHCGVLRVKNSKIDERLLAYILNQEGKSLEFSRTKRASVDRIKGIKIPLPSLEQQKEIVSKIEIIEVEIAKKEEKLKSIPNKKEEILKKYL